jgi:ABC-type uncharacterized transport system fused permease/ATPase subunit
VQAVLSLRCHERAIERTLTTIRTRLGAIVQAVLSLRWREWMTERMLADYMADRTFYNISASAVVDNPDQRLTSDISQFTSTSLSLAFTFLTSLVDLASFSGILFSIYPPLFAALVIYAVGGTVASFWIGKVRASHCLWCLWLRV